MPAQGDFGVLVFIGLLIANLALLFYVKLDFDKKVGGLSQEVEGIQVKDIKENLIHIQQNLDKRLAELLQEVKGVKESLLHVKQDFDERIVEVLQEIIDIFDESIVELMQEINGIRANDIREIREKIEKLNEEMKQLEQQTRERIDHIAKLLTEPILDESELKI
jgi:predicted  nucleic acid-binding Zn-ribbon protein